MRPQLSQRRCDSKKIETQKMAIEMEYLKIPVPKLKAHKLIQSPAAIARQPNQIRLAISIVSANRNTYINREILL